MSIAAIMPCRGRAAQTIENVRRLLATAGHDDTTLICACDGDEVVYHALEDAIGGRCNPVLLDGPQGYWRVLSNFRPQDERFLWCNLANDLWACDDWLRFAVEDYRAAFSGGDGLLGFSGDGHGYGHSCHFLISRGLLERYGGWPVWYSHNFGDRELCERAQQDGCYAKSTRAWLEHCHPMLGRADDDAVYQAGRATYRQDEALFVARRAAGWPKTG